jgi:hypothetical protein
MTITRRIKKRAAVAMAVAALGGGTLAAAPSALATDPNANGTGPYVQLQGSAGCLKTGDFPVLVQFNLNNGFTGSVGFLLYDYQLTVPNVPPQPSYAKGTATITCDGLSGRYSFVRTAIVFQPGLGQQWTQNFAGG